MHCIPVQQKMLQVVVLYETMTTTPYLDTKCPYTKRVYSENKQLNKRTKKQIQVNRYYMRFTVLAWKFVSSIKFEHPHPKIQIDSYVPRRILRHISTEMGSGASDVIAPPTHVTMKDQPNAYLSLITWLPSKKPWFFFTT